MRAGFGPLPPTTRISGPSTVLSQSVEDEATVSQLGERPAGAQYAEGEGFEVPPTWVERHQLGPT